ncbi:MAG: hypothetical protein ACTHJ0_14040 [Flavipsychrobacter sp.]
MKLSTLVILTFIALYLSSCVARVKTYNDGQDSYRWRRHHYDHHVYQNDPRRY